MDDNSIFKRFWKWIMNHFFKTFLILFLIQVLIVLLGQNIPFSIIVISFLILTTYVFVFLITHIGMNIKKLLHHELKFSEIIIVYISSVTFIVLLFSILYLTMTFIGAGYIIYGSCIDNIQITRSLIESDPLHVDSIVQYPYFSAITFFSVGFGDICPMGLSKLIAMLNALIGNAFTVLILAIAITNYSTNLGNSRKDKKEK